MDSDRELLEAAAKAAGYQIDKRASFMTWRDHRKLALLNPAGGHTLWNAWDDDGDAMRLGARLRINIEHMETMGRKPHGVNCWPVGRGDCAAMDHDVSDYAAAIRRAIVCAAAAVYDDAAELGRRG